MKGRGRGLPLPRDFTMRLMARNRYTNTMPCILHANGCAKTPLWRVILDEFSRSSVAPAHDRQFEKELTIGTWNTGTEKSPFEQSLDKMMLSYFVMGRGVKKWIRHQIFLTQQFLHKVETPYFMANDAFDAIMIESPARALDIFKNRYDGKGILYTAELNYWPEEAGTREHEESKPHRYRYLNSGGFIGETCALRDFFDSMLEDARDISKGFANDEQGIAHRHAAKPEFAEVVKLDHECRIFQPLFGVTPGEVELIKADYSYPLTIV